MGTTRRVVEHAEAMGLLRPAARTPQGAKLYGPEQVERLQLVLRLYRLGVSASRIKEWLARPLEEFPEHLAGHTQWLRQQAERALAQAAACEAEEAEVYSQLAALRGFASDATAQPQRIEDTRPAVRLSRRGAAPEPSAEC